MRIQQKEDKVPKIQNSGIELSIVMPCLNEAATLGVCIKKALSFLDENHIHGEIVIADNGSTDESVAIAESFSVIVKHIKEKGYGSALMGGIEASLGKYVIMGDSDDSYDFLNLMPFLDKLRSGYQFVIGNRFQGGLQPGAMPFLNRYIGNPFLSGIGRLFYNIPVGDFHCGLRGIQKEAYTLMDMQSKGMEFASEMVVKAEIYGLKVAEIPTKLSPDGRNGPSHLKIFRDGWRHLRFLFLYSPRWIFFYPALVMMIAGFSISALILINRSMRMDIHTMMYAAGLIMIGFQTLIFSIFTKTFAVHEKLLPMNPKIDKILKMLSLEKGLILGIILAVIGLCGSAYSYFIWEDGSFFKLGIPFTMRIVIASVTFFVLGFQLIFSSFFFHMLKLNNK